MGPKKKKPVPHETRVERIVEMVRYFLSERRESKGGWAEITDADVVSLNDIISVLVVAKCDRDPDGDFPIEWLVVNRLRFERLHFVPQPYDRDFVSGEIDGEPVGEPIETIMEIAELNLGIAHEKLETAFKTWRHYRREREERAFWVICAQAMYEKLDRPLTAEDVKEENLPELTEEDKRMLDNFDIEALLRRANSEFKAEQRRKKAEKKG